MPRLLFAGLILVACAHTNLGAISRSVVSEKDLGNDPGGDGKPGQYAVESTHGELPTCFWEEAKRLLGDTAQSLSLRYPCVVDARTVTGLMAGQ